jgi:regulatory protein
MAAARRPGATRKSCHERALGLLAVRMRSRRELRDRLLRAGFDADEVDDVVERLAGVGLIDDERFAEEYARHASEVRGSGRRAIASALSAKGVSRETVQRIVAEASDGEEARAEELARSRARRLADVPPASAYRRLVSLLARRGFEPELARRAARSALALEAAED